MAQKSPFGTIAGFISMRIAAFRQTPDQVFKRVPGDQLLSGPYPVQNEAAADWQYALLSVAAYSRSNPKRQAIPGGVSWRGVINHIWKHKKLSTPVAPNEDARLNHAGWTLWPNFPDATLTMQMHKSHLRAEVWENQELSVIAVAFGGTVFTSGKDWRSNLRWFTPRHQDEYTEIVKHFAPDFIKAFALRAAKPDMAIYSTGHSLGGGLAQQFAYAMPVTPEVPRVSRVFAFDPSPVTGFFSVDRGTRETNRAGLRIGRIYERGEILAVLRSFTSLIFKPSSVNPTITGVRLSLFYSIDPLVGHSIVELANKMENAA